MSIKPWSSSSKQWPNAFCKFVRGMNIKVYTKVLHQERFFFKSEVCTEMADWVQPTIRHRYAPLKFKISIFNMPKKLQISKLQALKVTNFKFTCFLKVSNYKVARLKNFKFQICTLASLRVLKTLHFEKCARLFKISFLRTLQQVHLTKLCQFSALDNRIFFNEDSEH